ncbi:hypothetical protein ACJMK2_001100 [Sinanodonta woodiana]|uniref:C-type lectin domain-containing protein n=1 Tax=Sinanodonta woodiana TaxID=1069815 RepID=A0ABD3XRD6_SINWO
MGNFSVFLSFLIFIVVNLPAGGNAKLSCPRGFELHGLRCYIALDLRASWPKAKEYCTILGGKLAAIASSLEQRVIAEILAKTIGKTSNPLYWLDGSDMLQSSEWRWMGDHGVPAPFSYTNWSPGQPNITNERCLEISYNWQSKWKNAHCWVDKSFICEARAVATEGEIINDILQDP